MAYPLPAYAPGQSPTYVPVDAGFVVARQPLTVLTQVYPATSAKTVTLFWANANYSSVSSSAMALTRTGVGPYSNNDEYGAVIPADALQAGQATRYWLNRMLKIGLFRNSP